MSVSASINSAKNASTRRLASRGGNNGTSGCRPPVKRNTTAYKSHPAQQYQLSSSRIPMLNNETGRCQRGLTAKIIWPPSSWPPGNKFSDVASIPTQAAIAMGCRYSALTGACATAAWLTMAANIEQISAALDRRLDADKSSQRPYQCRRRNKERQRGQDSMSNAVNVMSQL